MLKISITTAIMAIVPTLLLSGCSGESVTMTVNVTNTITVIAKTVSTTISISKKYPMEPLILYEKEPSKYEELPVVTPVELKAMIDSNKDVVIVDVSPLLVYNDGHIPGAIQIPWNYKGFTEDPKLPKSVLLVFYCICKNEEDSGLMALSAVTNYGYRNIVLLKGGTLAWEEAGNDLVQS